MVHRKGINQEPKKGILVLVIYIDCDIGDLYISISYMCIFRLGVVIYYFFVGSGVGILVVYLVSVYLVLFCLGGNWLYTWFVYKEIT